MQRVFDLEKAKENGCWTMDGHRVQIFCDDFRLCQRENFPIATRVSCDTYDLTLYYSLDGKAFPGGPECGLDLTTVDPNTFDLQRALDNNGRCKTRGGRDARIICTDRRDEYPIVALIGEQEFPFTYTLEGICDKDSEWRNDDLINL